MQGNQSWDFYFCTLGGKPASIKLHLTLLEQLPIYTHPQLVYLFVELNHPDKEGMIHPIETDAIQEMEEDIVRLMTSDLEGVFAVRCTGNGRRCLYFYMPPQLDTQELMEACMYAHTDYTYSLGALPDREWRFFRSILHPQLTKGISKSREQLLILESDSAFPQEVAHHLRFPSIEARDTFIDSIHRKQFAIGKEKFSATESEYPFELTISRIEYNHATHLQKVAAYLSQIAQENNGIYLDWEKLIIRIE